MGRSGGSLARCAAAAAAAAVCALLTVPASAAAHGLKTPADLPVPIGAFYAAATTILVVSFVLLGVLWHQPRWQQVPWRALPQGWSGVGSPLASTVGRGVVLLLFLLVWASTLFGTRSVGDTIAAVAIFVIFWIGIVPLSVVVGDLWGALNPWATLARLGGMEDDRSAEHGGHGGWWPATVLLLAFAWLELVYPTASHTRLMGLLIGAYSLLTIAGMARYGVSRWLDGGEAFSTYTRFLSSLAPFAWREVDGQRRLGLRPPVLGALEIAPRPGLVAFSTLLIGTVSFDGLSRTGWWLRRSTDAVVRLTQHGVSLDVARNGIGTVALLVMCLLAWGAFELACLAAERIGHLGPGTHGRVANAFAPTLAPIAVAYVVAHYFSFFIFQGQDIIRLLSDPFGRGWNLFGTDTYAIDYHLFPANGVWYVQVGAIVVGHVLGLVLAHERALALAPDNRRAVRSQFAMLALMALYTIGGLYFLSEGLT